MNPYLLFLCGSHILRLRTISTASVTDIFAASICFLNMYFHVIKSVLQSFRAILQLNVLNVRILDGKSCPGIDDKHIISKGKRGQFRYNSVLCFSP